MTSFFTACPSIRKLFHSQFMGPGKFQDVPLSDFSRKPYMGTDKSVQVDSKEANQRLLMALPSIFDSAG